MKCEKLAAEVILPATPDMAMSEHCLKLSSSDPSVATEGDSFEAGDLLASMDHSPETGCDCSSACGTSASVLPMFSAPSVENFVQQELTALITATAPFGVSDHPYRPPIA